MHHFKSMKRLKNDWKLTSASLCLILIVAIGIVISISSFPSVQANTIEKIGVGIYQDPKCVQSINQIEWGKINPGSAVSQTIYLRNELDFSALLSLSALNWAPDYASRYLTLSWNYSGQRLIPEEVIPVELTLLVSENTLDLTDFSFTIRISANK
jgi:hypothetical protein